MRMLAGSTKKIRLRKPTTDAKIGAALNHFADACSKSNAGQIKFVL